MKKLIAGNWKMNTTMGEARELATAITQAVTQNPDILDYCDLLACPPFVYVPTLSTLCKNQALELGAQDCSSNDKGAYTGEISASMLKETGCSFVIVGHSERRQYHNESNELVSTKANCAHNNELTAIICVGESEEERETNKQNSVVEDQITNSLPKSATAQNTVIAYEPVWAIGTGKTASPSDVADMHLFIRELLEKLLSDGGKVRILYGGSMKPSNANELLSTPNVDGGLIGGASLKADDFIAIAQTIVKS